MLLSAFGLTGLFVFNLEVCMKLMIQKKVLAGALVALGKMVSRLSPVVAQRSVLIAGKDGVVLISATDGVELMAAELAVELEGAFTALVPFAELKECLRNAKSGEIVLSVEAGTVTVSETVRGKVSERTFLAVALSEWPLPEAVPRDVKAIALPEGVVGMLAHAAQIVNRQETRLPLRGINLSRDGITVTDGKQLLNIPVPLELTSDVTIPFPLALLTAAPEGAGTLVVWQSKYERLFEIRVGNWCWCGKLLSGNYPNWRQVVPSTGSMDYTVKITDHTGCVEFLRKVPDNHPHHAIGLHFAVDCLEMVSMDFPELKLKIPCEFVGKLPSAPLVLNKYALLRIFNHGHDTIKACHAFAPVLASGGMGNLLVMPINCNPNFAKKATSGRYDLQRKTAGPRAGTTCSGVSSNQKPIKEEPKMEVKTENTKVEVTEPISAMDELNHGIDELRLKLKTLLDESAILTRKVKEAALQQKQKEREFIQARRAIERIRMASGF